MKKKPRTLSGTSGLCDRSGEGRTKGKTESVSDRQCDVWADHHSSVFVKDQSCGRQELYECKFDFLKLLCGWDFSDRVESGVKTQRTGRTCFLTSLAGLIIVLFWIVPYIYELFETMQSLLRYKS